MRSGPFFHVKLYNRLDGIANKVVWPKEILQFLLKAAEGADGKLSGQMEEFGWPAQILDGRYLLLFRASFTNQKRAGLCARVYVRRRWKDSVEDVYGPPVEWPW